MSELFSWLNTYSLYSCVHWPVPFILANMAEEEVVRFVVGNDTGMRKAALAGDDAPRDSSVTSRSADSTFIRLNTRSRH